MYKIDLVKKYIMDEIEKGNIKKGQRLPGCREVAIKLSVNKITVNKAYKTLEDLHTLYCVPRGGYYFVGTDDLDVVTSKTVDFYTVKADPSLIPYRAFTHAMNRAIEEHKKILFNYDTPLGLANLRDTLKVRFECNGVYAQTTQILITHGAQQGIYLALKSLFQNPIDGKLLVEIPTYNVVLDMATSLNIDFIGINRYDYGINLDELETLFKKEPIKAFYIIPMFHNPTGYSLNERDKKKIVELCYRYHVILIEDDYLADLTTDKRILPLHYYDTNELTIYIRSFSKTFMPGIRLGAMVIPKNLCDIFIKYKYILDISTSSITQGALDFFIKSGMYDRHIKKVNSSYKRKLLKCRAILTNVYPKDLLYHIPKQGIFLWLTLPGSVAINGVIEKLGHHNILIGSCSEYYKPHNAEQNLRLCISSISEEDIIALVKVIEIIKEEMQ